MAFEPCYLLAFGPYYLGLNCIRICRLNIGKDKFVLKFFFFFLDCAQKCRLNVGKNKFGLKFFFFDWAQKCRLNVGKNKFGPKNAGLM